MHWIAFVLVTLMFVASENWFDWYAGTSTPAWLSWAFFGAMVYLTARFYFATFHAQSAVILNQRQCLACAYELGKLRPAPDGCTVCPECGAAWKLPIREAQTPDA